MPGAGVVPAAGGVAGTSVVDDAGGATAVGSAGAAVTAVGAAGATVVDVAGAFAAGAISVLVIADVVGAEGYSLV